jgi:arylformamidase
MMFIHGGYWRALDKKDFSFLAPAWVDAGVSLAVVNYDLLPAHRHGGDRAADAARQPLAVAARRGYGMDQDRLYVSGHSAGGHLTAMADVRAVAGIRPRAAQDLWKGGLAISGCTTCARCSRSTG